jgi:predicted DNA-binding transcriptional regulator YafY
MDKVAKILLLVNLLNHRRYVTLDEITATCKISDRTAYRYINTISAAHIPVYYDKSVSGYRLLSEGAFSVGKIGSDDAIMIAVALRLLTKKMNGFYSEEIELLTQRLFSSQNFPLEELWETFENRANLELEKGDFSDLITNLIIHMAVLNSKKLYISLADDADKIRRMEIEDPSLCFKDEWRLTGKKVEPDRAIPISRIKKASIS